MKHHTDPADNKLPQEDGSNLPSPTETRRRLTKVFFRELLKTAFYPLAAAAIIVIGSIAWFVSNTRVQSGMIPISASDETVRLATKGVRQEAEETLLKLTEGDTLDYDNNTYYYTEGGTIALRLSEQYMISPGAFGPIEFYIIPTRDGPATVTLYLDLAGYTAIQDQGTTTGVEPVTDDPALDALLSGHILLFNNYENSHYSDWLFQTGTGANSITNAITVFLPEDAKKDVPQSVKLYWVWPLRYENMKDLYIPGVSDDQTRFVSFIEAQAESENMKPLAGNSSGNSSNPYRYSRIFLTNEELVDDDSRSNAYNLADEYIGTNADYLYLTIQTEPTSSSTGSDVDAGKEQP